MNNIFARINNISARINNMKLVQKVLGEKATEQFIRYIIVGVSTVTIESALYLSFTYLIRHLMPDFTTAKAATIANIFAVTIIFWFNFFMNRNWTYKSTSNIWKQLSIYAPLFFFNIFASSSIIYLLVTHTGLHYFLAKALSIGVILCWNLIIYKKIIFKD